MRLTKIVFATIAALSSALCLRATDTDNAKPNTWMADNGNGSYTNPLFYDEFSDPDIIRVGDDYYLTGTTMHTMPGLPILHSRDLVNWDFVTYAMKQLDLGPAFHLEGGEIYGRGIWAPCFRYHNGTFYIFTNVNGHKTQLYRATSPAGPWLHSELGGTYHDLSVLFDDDGKVYVVWDYNEIKIAQLKPDLSDIIPETKRVLIPAGSGMGEGSHFYHINGHYYIFSANYDPICYEVVARADHPEGPYSVITTSAMESFGLGTGWRLASTANGQTGLTLIPPKPEQSAAMAMHQGGIVQTQSGEWWGLSMMDHNSIGRLTCLSPITWQNDWPFFGLPGNLTRSPLTWIKPKTGFTSPPHAPYERSDDFSSATMKPIWQWNHVPDNTRWSLTERPGALRLHALPAKDFWTARDTLTQRAIGPESIVTVEIDTAGMKTGDVGGLALLNLPYAWMGAKKSQDGFNLIWFDQTTGNTKSVPLSKEHLWLRVHSDYDREKSAFSYSEDGAAFQPLGEDVTTVFQLKTFQGVRYALFNFNENGTAGGYLDFSHFKVDEPRAKSFGSSIPLGKSVVLTSRANGAQVEIVNGLLRAAMRPHRDQPGVGRFVVVDRGQGRVALQAEDGSGFVAVTGAGEVGDLKLIKGDSGKAATFQWQQMENGDFMLISLVTERYVMADTSANGLFAANARGASPDPKAGVRFTWSPAP